MVEPAGVHSRSATSATALPIAVSVICRKSSASSAGSASPSAVPSSAEAIWRSSVPLQSAPDAPAVADEPALAGAQHRRQLIRRLVLVAPVGEQDGVLDLGRARREELVGQVQPMPMAVPP